MNSLLNKTNVRKFALNLAEKHRPAAGFTRVSNDFLLKVEASLYAYIHREIHRQPSKGVTIK